MVLDLSDIFSERKPVYMGEVSLWRLVILNWWEEKTIFKIKLFSTSQDAHEDQQEVIFN